MTIGEATVRALEAFDGFVVDSETYTDLEAAMEDLRGAVAAVVTASTREQKP